MPANRAEAIKTAPYSITIVEPAYRRTESRLIRIGPEAAWTASNEWQRSRIPKTLRTCLKNKEDAMPESCRIHKEHSHKHGPKCGHTAVKHEGHTDYLHDGHLHHAHENHVDEHVIAIDAKHPASVKAPHDCGGHTSGHKHAPGCGHEAVPHGDHTDYLVKGHLHHSEGGKCHDHGSIEVIEIQAA